ncbi:hypothetical protein L3Q67_01060 [Saccharothrix sp. AJ9571]|nr:hypothetical protein L3Q67_01060 [Saccharothrix sp. AJ9571]
MIHRTPGEKRRHRATTDLLEESERLQAVPCRGCGQGIGQACINPTTGDELRAPAHPQRYTDTKQKGGSDDRR